MENIKDNYFISDEIGKYYFDLKILNYAIKHLNKMEKALKIKLFSNAKKEINNFVKRMKKIGYDYYKTGEELKKDVLLQKFKKDYSIGLRNALLGNESRLKDSFFRLKEDAKGLNFDISKKIERLEKICLEKNVEKVWEEIGTSLLQEDLDLKEIIYIENAFPLLKKNVEKLEPKKKRFLKKQFLWAEKTFYEKAMITYYKRFVSKKSPICYKLVKLYAKEIGIIL